MDHSEVIDENTSESFHQNLMEEEITLPESPESLPASNLRLIQKSGTESFKVKEEESPSRLGHSFFSSLFLFQMPTVYLASFFFYILYSRQTAFLTLSKPCWFFLSVDFFHPPGFCHIIAIKVHSLISRLDFFRTANPPTKPL